MEDEEEYEVYHTTPYHICTLYIVIIRGKPNEDDLIDHIIQIQPPTAIPLKDIVRESESHPWIELHSVESTSEDTKVLQYFKSIPMNIKSSLLAKEEEKLCQHLRENLDVFS